MVKGVIHFFTDEMLEEEYLTQELSLLPLINVHLNREDMDENIQVFSFCLDVQVSDSVFDKNKWLLKMEEELSVLSIPFSIVSFTAFPSVSRSKSYLSKKVSKGEIGINKVHKLLALYLTPYAPYSVDDATISKLAISIKNSLSYDGYDEAYDFLKSSLQDPDQFKHYADSTIRIYGSEDKPVNNQHYYQLVSQLVDSMEEEERNKLAVQWERQNTIKQVKQARVEQVIPSSAQLLATHPRFPRITLKSKGLAQDNQIQVGIMKVANIDVHTRYNFVFNPIGSFFPVNQEVEDLYQHLLELNPSLSSVELRAILKNKSDKLCCDWKDIYEDKGILLFEREAQRIFEGLEINSDTTLLYRDLLLSLGIVKSNKKTKKQNSYSSAFVNMYIDEKNEKQIIEKLSGAQIVDHPLANLPDYSIWTTLDEGKSLQLKKAGIVINYVPHYKGEKKSITHFVINKDKVDKYIEQMEETDHQVSSLTEQHHVLKMLQNYRDDTNPYQNLSLDTNNLDRDLLALRENEDAKLLSLDFYDKVEEKVLNQQTAVRTERGRLTVYCDDQGTVEPQKLIRVLQDMDIVEVEQQAPQTFVSSITPVVNCKNINQQKLVLPDNHFVVHGLTGCEISGMSSFSHSEDKQEVLQRLKMIVETGGLVPTRDRRQMGYNLRTTSPSGDIASGIDSGIACTVTDVPSYGNSVFFICKDSVLYRDKIWFAPFDFGAGGDRFAEYQKYAKSIGQESIFSSPSIETRQEHFDSIDDDSNEIWFTGGLNLHEVGMLLVNQMLQEDVEPLIEEWKQLGYLQEHIRIKFFPHGQEVELSDYCL